MQPGGENDRRSRARWAAIGYTAAAAVYLLPSLFVAAFTLWGIGEQNWPPPFFEAPLVWATNTFAIGGPVVTLGCAIAAWICFVRGRYRSLFICLAVSIAWAVLSIPAFMVVLS